MPSAAVHAPVQIAPWAGPGVSKPLATAAAESARKVWGRLGLEVQLRPTQALPAETPGLLFAPESAHSDPSTVTAPLQAVLDRLPAANTAVPMVVMARFADAPAAGVSLRGFTLPAAGPLQSNRSLPDALEHVRRAATPVIFLDASAGPRAPGDLSLTPAHELGHALGLVHHVDAQALMSSGALSLRCIPGLTEAEWAVVNGPHPTP